MCLTVSCFTDTRCLHRSRRFRFLPRVVITSAVTATANPSIRLTVCLWPVGMLSNVSYCYVALYRICTFHCQHFFCCPCSLGNLSLKAVSEHYASLPFWLHCMIYFIIIRYLENKYDDDDDEVESTELHIGLAGQSCRYLIVPSLVRKEFCQEKRYDTNYFHVIFLIFKRSALLWKSWVKGRLWSNTKLG